VTVGGDGGSERGHRLVPHTADLRLEAWAPTRGGCMEEAVAALVEGFADLRGAVPQRSTSFGFACDSDDLLLARVLDEVIYLVEVSGHVPGGVTVRDAEDGGVTGEFGLVPVDQVVSIGALPKAVTLEDLALHRIGDRWVARATVDV
jgi:SHS2 domain-containing protein